MLFCLRPVPLETVPSPGSRYVALAGTPAMTDDRGRVLDPARAMFHEFRFVGRDADGTSRFVVDGVTNVRTKAADPFRKDALRPLVESETLTRLRERYLNRHVWAYGGIQAQADLVSPRSTATFTAPYDRPLKIVRIYQTARVPVAANVPGLVFHGVRFPGSYDADDLGKDGLFIFVYDRKGMEFDSGVGREGWSKEAYRRLQNPRLYSPPYGLFTGAWMVPRLFSPTPAPASILRVLDRKSGRTRDGSFSLEKYLKGLTRFQVVWYLGWPLRGHPTAKDLRGPIVPISQLLRSSMWEYGDYYYVTFKRGRVDSYFEASFH